MKIMASLADNIATLFDSNPALTTQITAFQTAVQASVVADTTPAITPVQAVLAATIINMLTQNPSLASAIQTFYQSVQSSIAASDQAVIQQMFTNVGLKVVADPAI